MMPGVLLIKETGGDRTLNRWLSLRFHQFALFNTSTAKAGTVFRVCRCGYSVPACINIPVMLRAEESQTTVHKT